MTTENLQSHGIFAFSVDPNGGDIVIKTRDHSIVTKGQQSHGINAQQQGLGKIDIDLEGGSIETRGGSAYGVRAYRGISAGPDPKPISVRISDGHDITTMGSNSHGLYADQSADGKIEIFASDSRVTTQGANAHGIYGRHPFNKSGDVRLDVRRTSVETGGNGITGRHTGVGDVYIFAEDSSVTTDGILAYGIFAHHYGSSNSDGDVIIRTRNHNILSKSTDLDPVYNNTFSPGVYGRHVGTGDIAIDLQGGSVETRGFFSPGVYGYHLGTGDIAIDLQGGAVKTTGGGFSYGIYGRHEKTDQGGEVMIRTGGGNTVTTTGEDGHGIVAYNFGTLPTSRIVINIEGDVTTTGARAQGVRVGTVSDDGNVARVPVIDDDGYRRQTVTVNGAVRSKAEGVFLAGGGRMIVGPKGRIDSESGIAVLATGDTPGADPGVDSPIKPKLRVDLNLGNPGIVQALHDALGDDWILNDGGETTIALNGVVLHDGAAGATGRKVADGAWDVWMREAGVLVEDRTDPDPANWVISEPSEGVIADRDFSRGDFAAEYAPRSAVYEALPGALFRLDTPGLPEGNLMESGAPVWIRLSGGGGSSEPNHATVDAEYNFDRFSAEAGLNVSLGETFTGMASVRSIRGDADVNVSTGGGQIEMDGAGVTLGVSYNKVDAYYARGRLSLAYYDLDLSSDTRGRLKENLDARSRVLDLEVGRRMAVRGTVIFTPRLWARHSRVKVDDFTDAVGSSVSVDDESRFFGGLGVIAETQCAVENGELFLRGSVDLERTFSGSTAHTDVSGTRLSSEATKSRALLSLDGAYRRGSFSAKAGVSAVGPGSDDESYSGHIRLGWEY